MGLRIRRIRCGLLGRGRRAQHKPNPAAPTRPEKRAPGNPARFRIGRRLAHVGGASLPVFCATAAHDAVAEGRAQAEGHHDITEKMAPVGPERRAELLHFLLLLFDLLLERLRS